MYELSSYLKVSKSTPHKLAQDGKLPGRKVGRYWSFHRGAVDEWRGKSARQPTTDAGRPKG